MPGTFPTDGNGLQATPAAGFLTCDNKALGGATNTETFFYTFTSEP
jgi:hypothetical protein